VPTRYTSSTVALPIAIYNIIAEVIAITMPIACIYASNTKKYFNTVLVYCAITIIAKIVQIIVLMLFSNSGSCILQMM
jgi:hypothetical protein